ncbi:MAG: efflux RND transporter periplasmic adaptor subunit [Lysobacteraceae bacterium]
MKTLPMTSIRSFLLLLVLAIAGCSGDRTPSDNEATHAWGGSFDEHANEKAAGHSDEHGDDEQAPAVVLMDAASLEAAGIRLQTLTQSSPDEQLRAPGEVLDNAYGTTLITPRVDALVVSRHVRLGDEVEQGARLVTLASVEVSDAQAELRIAEQEWQRVSELGREAVSGRRISEARIAMDRARARAKAYGLSGSASGIVNGQFTLTAPHAGRITEDDFVVGQRIEPGTPLFRLVDESTVWVDAKLPSGVVPRLNAGSPATIVADGQRVSGKVLRAAHRTSEATRSAVVRIEVPNAGDHLHGGDFVDVYLDADSGDGLKAQLAVPTNALVQLEGDTVVFRRNQDGALEPVPVRPGAVIGDQTVVTEGLMAGDTVVVDGAFVVKAQLLKSQLGEGHAH